MLKISFFLIFLLIRGFTTSLCNFNVKVTQVLHNEGFHRNLTYKIIFNGDDGAETQLFDDCVVGLEQILPAGLYANPDELSDLRRMQKVNAVLKSPVNVELPAEDSHPIKLYIIGKVTRNKASLWLPVHARYHYALPGGNNVLNKIDVPKVYVRIPDQYKDVCQWGVPTMIKYLCKGNSKQNSNWKKVSYDIMTKTLLWPVPVGNTDHYCLVASGTATVIVAGSLYLLKILHEYKVAAMKKKS